MSTVVFSTNEKSKGSASYQGASEGDVWHRLNFFMKRN